MNAEDEENGEDGNGLVRVIDVDLWRRIFSKWNCCKYPGRHEEKGIFTDCILTGNWTGSQWTWIILFGLPTDLT